MSADDYEKNFDVRKYYTSEQAQQGFVPLFVVSTKVVLSCCFLNEKSYKLMETVLTHPWCLLKDLDLSNNDMKDSGLKLLCETLSKPACKLETLRLSGCLITREGCEVLASTLASNPSHLKELDLSYNHPEEHGVALLSAGVDNPDWALETLRLEPSGLQFLRPGLSKYAVELILDSTTTHRNLTLSEFNRIMTVGQGEKLSRFHNEEELLGRHELTGRCYWEAEWRGNASIGVTYKEIRRGESNRCGLGMNDQSWALLCSKEGFSVLHNNKITKIYVEPSNKVGVFVDRPGGTVSFFGVFPDEMTYLHTYNTKFTQPVYPVLRIEPEPVNISLTFLCCVELLFIAGDLNLRQPNDFSPNLKDPFADIFYREENKETKYFSFTSRCGLHVSHGHIHGNFTMSQSEESKEASVPINYGLSCENGTQVRPQSTGNKTGNSSTPSIVSLKSEKSMHYPSNFKGSSTPSIVSLKSEKSMNYPSNFKGSSTPSVVSLKSEKSMNYPSNFKGSSTPSVVSLKSEKSMNYPSNFKGSSTPSIVSLKSEKSMNYPSNFKGSSTPSIVSLKSEKSMNYPSNFKGSSLSGSDDKILEETSSFHGDRHKVFERLERETVLLVRSELKKLHQLLTPNYPKRLWTHDVVENVFHCEETEKIFTGEEEEVTNFLREFLRMMKLGDFADALSSSHSVRNPSKVKDESHVTKLSELEDQQLKSDRIPPKEDMDTIFKNLEGNIVVFVKNELRNFLKLLNRETVHNQEENEEVLNWKEEEQKKMTKEAFLKMILKHLRRMKQEKLAFALLNKSVMSKCQSKLKSNLKTRLEYVIEGIAKEGHPNLLNKIYTDLYITERDEEIIRDHEVKQIEKALRKKMNPQTIRREELFKPITGRDKPVRTVMTEGVAGIGKTVLTQKFALDWAEGKNNQDIQFTFPFSFRGLNMVKGKKFSLVELIHLFFPEVKVTEIRSFEHFRVLFIFDGLDECRFPLDLKTKEVLTDVTQSASLEVLLANLIKGRLLPSAQVWITTRPAAAHLIPPEFVDLVTEIQGFNDRQKEEYFRKRFPEEEESKMVLSHIKSSRSLYIMCHIPVFCWILATVLEDAIKAREEADLPNSLTEMYILYLVVLSKVKKVKYDENTDKNTFWTPETREMIKSLGKLAFEQLMKGNLFFYESDLTECGIDVRAASVYSGVFTEIFKEEKGFFHQNMFCFVHLSIQEFLAALHVHLTFIKTGVNLLAEEESVSPGSKMSEEQVEHFYKKAIEKATENAPVNSTEVATKKATDDQKGKLDLLLRFLLGLSLKTNQRLLKGFVTKRKTSSSSLKNIVLYIKEKIEKILCPFDKANLFHCLNELKELSLVKEIEQILKSGKLETENFSEAQWATLIHSLLSSDDYEKNFDVRKYYTSEQAQRGFAGLLINSTKVVLSCSFLNEKSCPLLGFILSCRLGLLKDLDLSNNDLKDSGLKLLCEGLSKPECKLETLRLSGCLITREGCEVLASALASNPSHLKELDLSYNHPEEHGVALLSAGVDNPDWALETLRLDPSGLQFLKPGLSKYAVELILDSTTTHRNLTLSEFNRIMTVGQGEKLSRFDNEEELLGRHGLTGRCYWEAEWRGNASIGVTYKDIRRRGQSNRCGLGMNDQSWALLCSKEGFSVLHNNKITKIYVEPSNKVGVFVDRPGGTVSFFGVFPDEMTYLHTYNTKFTQPVYPVLRIEPEPVNIRMATILSYEQICCLKSACGSLALPLRLSAAPPAAPAPGLTREDVPLQAKVLQVISINAYVSKLQNLLSFCFSESVITLSQNTLKSNLNNRFGYVFEGLDKAGYPTLLNQIYTELYITEGTPAQVNCKHEVKLIERALFRPTKPELRIRREDIFKRSTGRDKPIRTVMTEGVAGIGKTVLTKKISLDWAEGKIYQHIQFIFPLSFRELNMLEEKISLVELIHLFFPEIKEAGIHTFEEFKVLFIFDGLDECRLPLNLKTKEVLTDVTEPTSLDVMLTNLIKGKLLPSACIWITTRPAAAHQIPPEFVDLVTEVRGFNDPQKEEYFRKRFPEEEESGRIISHINSSRSIFIMCHIPVFCWITATVLEDAIKTNQERDLPKSLTEMYVYFLVVLSKVKYIKYKGRSDIDSFWTTETKDTIQSLGKLAFEQLMKGNLFFYESDLTECGIDIRAASVYSGLFTEIFQEERGLFHENVFCFVHLSIQEFLAALHVHLTFTSTGINLLAGEESALTTFEDFHQCAVDKAVQSPNGHLDLFLRFLLGLSLENNQSFLRGLITEKGSDSSSSQNTIQYIKKKIGENICIMKNNNLFHCLNELKDGSLVEEIQAILRPGRLPADKLPPVKWAALVNIILSSTERLDEFYLNKYFESDNALTGLLTVIVNSTKAVLSCCNLTDMSCRSLASALQSKCLLLKELDFSNNDLKDSGVKLLCEGLCSPHCTLETLSLSGCLITNEGCADLVSSLKLNPSHLKKLDLSYNHLEECGVKHFSAGQKDFHLALQTLTIEPSGSQFLKPGLRKYACELMLDPNSTHKNLILSDNNRKVTVGEEQQPYPDHPERFEVFEQLLCSDGLTGRCYWEVEWRGRVDIAVTYRRIKRKGENDVCSLGKNDESWSLLCSDGGHSGLHKNEMASIYGAPSNRIGVYLDWPGGILSFFAVSSGKLTHLHTFHAKFTEPVFPAFRITTEPRGSSLFLSHIL
ncbi:uncharacterized protein LOC129370840 [Poeciliopsis prolifica]|uniref:uncharacterized protein LOC129370840 n=1 Tax=Poeciliopsis prolifica TaxID=188132 RepID=UPI00241323EB|nr:uncharacterized protein LOC129370840 [Poeciliopsis prolifica]